MIEDINLLKFRSASGRNYLFDAIDNEMYEVDSDADINAVTQADLGRSTGVRTIDQSSDNVKNGVNSGAKTLIIELTEKCNLRCTYCVFDESFDSERSHSNKSASLEDLKQAIRDFYSRTNQEEAYVVFYGGEPLIEFELMKELVAYAAMISENKIKYSTTTNATQLTEQKIAFLVENDFKVTVSIDGPESVNDRYRIKINKKGSWSEVISTLESIKRKHPSFYARNIGFNCVISDANDADAINDFFQQNNLFENSEIRFSAEISKSAEINNLISQRSKKLFKSAKSFNQVGSKIEKDYLGTLIDKVRYRKIGESAKTGKKQCIPFSNRTYIRSDGEIQFCERIQNNSVQKKGSTAEELASSSVLLAKEFVDFKQDDCSKCFAYNFCEMCPASFMVNGSLNKKVANQKCDLFRSDVRKAIEVYINIKEEEEALNA